MGEAGSRRGETEASDAGAASGGRRGKDKKALPAVRGASRGPGGGVARVGTDVLCWGTAPSRGPDLFSQTSPRVCPLWVLFGLHRAASVSPSHLAVTVPGAGMCGFIPEPRGHRSQDRHHHPHHWNSTNQPCRRPLRAELGFFFTLLVF